MASRNKAQWSHGRQRIGNNYHSGADRSGLGDRSNVTAYPSWAHDVKSVNVQSSDDEGRPLDVEFRASALGRTTHYTLRYDYSDAPPAELVDGVRRHSAIHRWGVHPLVFE